MKINITRDENARLLRLERVLLDLQKSLRYMINAAGSNIDICMTSEPFVAAYRALAAYEAAPKGKEAP